MGMFHKLYIVNLLIMMGTIILLKQALNNWQKARLRVSMLIHTTVLRL